MPTLDKCFLFCMCEMVRDYEKKWVPASWKDLWNGFRLHTGKILNALSKSAYWIKRLINNWFNQYNYIVIIIVNLIYFSWANHSFYRLCLWFLGLLLYYVNFVKFSRATAFQCTYEGLLLYFEDKLCTLKITKSPSLLGFVSTKVFIFNLDKASNMCLFSFLFIYIYI